MRLEFNRIEFEKSFFFKKDTGEFIRKSTGKIAGGMNGSGYISLQFGWKRYRVHHIVWFLEKNEWPELLDHINGNRSDNRLSNLRIANRSQNTANSKLRKDNKIGFKGVSKHTKGHKYGARIRVNGIGIHLGYFHTPELAHKAYLSAASKYFGEYVRSC